MAPRVFYPSCTVAIGLRFDDALHYIRSAAVTPETEIARRLPPGDLNRSQIQSLFDAVPTQEPLFVSSGNSDALSWLVNVVPRSAVVSKPGFRDAGTFDLELGYHELPFDPRLVKACQVRVFLGTVTPESFAQGVVERADLGRGRRVTIVRPSVINGTDAQGHPDLDKLAIWGDADEFELKIGDNPTLQIKGRDLRALFIASPMRKGVLGKLDLTQPIDQVVKQIINSHPLGAQMQIAVLASEWPGGKVPSPGVAGNLTKVHLGATGQGKGGPPPSQQESKLNYWSAIYQYCFLVGAVPYFRGVQLCIRPAQSLYDLRDKANFTTTVTPFAGGLPRRGPDGRPFAVRKLSYGHNIKNLRFKRNLRGPERPRVIEVVCIDTSSEQRGKQKLLRAVYPEDVAKQLAKLHANKESPSGQLAENEVQRVPVYGIRSVDQLKQIAKAIFETTARYEIEGDYEVSDLASYGGDNDDADMLRLAVGDPVELTVAPSSFNPARSGDVQLVSDMNRIAGMPFDEAVNFVAQQIGDQNFARAVVATSRGLVVETESTYRTSEVTVNWSKDSGARVTGKFHNFIEARYGATTPPPAQKGARTITTEQPKSKSILDADETDFLLGSG